jgi:predicted nucleic-acid-binding Zn-ribbon protein
MRHAAPKSMPTRTCPKCGNESLEYGPEDWEGDPSEGSRLMNRIPASWSCSECDHGESYEPGEEQERDESAYMDREFDRKHYGI